MNNLGILLHGRGDEAEAEAWYRKATDAGNTDRDEQPPQ
ncbi:tetratricopeptide repeat protein [Nocardia testacea]|nr:tetratricopeptide repeat protein [Nocardia testacea]